MPSWGPRGGSLQEFDSGTGLNARERGSDPRGFREAQMKAPPSGSPRHPPTHGVPILPPLPPAPRASRLPRVSTSRMERIWEPWRGRRPDRLTRAGGLRTHLPASTRRAPPLPARAIGGPPPGPLRPRRGRRARACSGSLRSARPLRTRRAPQPARVLPPPRSPRVLMRRGTPSLPPSRRSP